MTEKTAKKKAKKSDAPAAETVETPAPLVRPLADRVLVRLDAGIVVGGDPQRGTVVAVGPGRRTPDGWRAKVELSVGEVVLFTAGAGTPVPGTDDMLILYEDAVLAYDDRPAAESAPVQAAEPVPEPAPEVSVAETAGV